jgi:hypothetical protein
MSFRLKDAQCNVKDGSKLKNNTDNQQSTDQIILFETI